MYWDLNVCLDKPGPVNMGTYIPMEDGRRNDNAATMLYLRDPLSNSQSQPPLLPGSLVYMNFSSSASPAGAASLPFSDAYSDSGGPQQVLLNFGSGRGVDGHLMVGGDSGVVHSLQGQGLSLSLATNVMQMAPVQDFASFLGGSSALMPGEERARSMSFENEDGSHCQQARDGNYVLSSGLGGNTDVLPAYGISRGVPNSKYLKAAQELLDEVVNVKQAVKLQKARKEEMKDAATVDGEGEPSNEAANPSTVALPSELSVAEKHELQSKLSKLLLMLDEVDRRYRQYYHQMQIVVSSFDVVAGNGASRPYTALALQTISQHFRSLRDAINNQIHVARKSLGEDDASSNNKGVGISRLRYVDQQLRQQKALQQLGMIQQHTWRPQRGLPESSVSILRAWLFEHFLHPYPKDSDKLMLARQTGLTRSQVSNWFINARVRLWKPMVEEMYKEEAGDADMDSNSSSETTTRAAKTPTKPSEDLQQSETSPGSRSKQMADMMGSETSSSILHNMISQSSYSAGRARDVVNKQIDNSNSFPDGMMELSSGSERFLAGYHMSEIGRFGNAGGVSLTLGLQHEGTSMAMVECDSDMYNAAAVASDMGGETAEFDCMDSGSRPLQFVTSLLPSFL